MNLNFDKDVEKYNNVYPNQIETARDVCKYIYTKLSDDKRPILINAETQAGKTGLMLSISELILNNEPDAHFCVWTFPDTTVFNQTEKRIEEWKRYSGKSMATAFFPRAHNASKKNASFKNLGIMSSSRKTGNKYSIEFIKNTQKNVYIFMDEADRGQGYDSTWDAVVESLSHCNNVTIIYITATPSPFIGGLKTCQEVNELYKIFYMSPGVGYLGIDKIKKSGRLFEAKYSTSFNGRKRNQSYANIYEFVQEIINLELIENRKIKKGDFLVRVSNSNSAETLSNIILSFNFINNTRVVPKIYSSELKNISNLSGDPDDPDNLGDMELEKDLEQINVRIFIQALQRGKTIDTSTVVGFYDNLNKSAQRKKNGKEKCYSNEVALIQSIGRNCGYEHDYDYPIWTDVETIEKSIAVYHELKGIAEGKFPGDHKMQYANEQTGTFVKTSKKVLNKTFYHKHFVVDSKEKVYEEILKFMDQVECQYWCKDNEDIDITKRDVNEFLLNNIPVNNCSKIFGNSLAYDVKNILNASFQSQKHKTGALAHHKKIKIAGKLYNTIQAQTASKTNYIIQTMYLDAPNPSHLNDWKDLSEEVKGKWFVSIAISQRTNINNKSRLNQ